MDWGKGKGQKKKVCPKGKTRGARVIDFGLEGMPRGCPRWVLRWLEPE